MRVENSSPALSIVVVGAGIGGLSVALALANDGHKVLLVERAASIQEVGAGLQVSPNGFRALQELGVADQVDVICHRPEAVIMRDSVTSAELGIQTLGAAFEARFGFPYRVAHRADLQLMLLKAVQARADLIEIRLGQEIAGFSQDMDGGVEVRFADGQSLRADIVVGADGLWSRIRAVLHGEEPPRMAGYIVFRGVLPSDQVPADILHDNVLVWVGPNHHMVSYKLRGDGSLFNIAASIRSGTITQGWGTFGDPDDIRAAFSVACPQVKRFFDLPVDWKVWTLCDRDPIANWGQGRVTLLGDAAHPMLPHLAQGACMAMEDAVRLAHEIRNVPGDIPAALRAYEVGRIPRTASVQLSSREAGDAYHFDGVEREARNAAMVGNRKDEYETNAWLFDGLEPRPAAASNTGMFDLTSGH